MSGDSGKPPASRRRQKAPAPTMKGAGRARAPSGPPSASREASASASGSGPSDPTPDAATRQPAQPPGNRKLIRPSLAEHGAALRAPRSGKGRRGTVPAPEQTGAEQAWYARRAAQSTPLVLRLEDGQDLRGVLEWHDRDSLKLRQPDGGAVVVMKQVVVRASEDRRR